MNRGACTISKLVKLMTTAMPDYAAIVQRFYPSSLVSLQVGEKTYGLPEIQTYNMLFYRADIFREQELTVPKTSLLAGT